MEVVIPPMIDFFTREFVIEKDKARRRLCPNPWLSFLLSDITDKVIGKIKARVWGLLKNFIYYRGSPTIYDLIGNIRGMIDTSFIVGEGWLMPAEIIEMAKRGISSFLILNPFGCLPNHISADTDTLDRFRPGYQFCKYRKSAADADSFSPGISQKR
jgi:predicted nucleotide-binding protein (sugar kinase/HSP70/actin superfamily)